MAEDMVPKLDTVLKKLEKRVMSNARKLKDKNFGISVDLPKETVDQRKKVRPKFFAGKKVGKSAYFSRAEPNKLFIDGRLSSA